MSKGTFEGVLGRHLLKIEAFNVGDYMLILVNDLVHMKRKGWKSGLNGPKGTKSSEQEGELSQERSKGPLEQRPSVAKKEARCIQHDLDWPR